MPSTPIIDLSGSWKRLLDGEQIDSVSVPGSYRPVAECLLEHEFTSSWNVAEKERIFLVTEGVLSTAEFSLNDKAIGKAGPWCTYRFELPPGLLQKRNTLQALVRDITEPFGPMPGRRFDGGLARPLWIERRPETFLADMHFTYELDHDLKKASCQVTVDTDGPDRPEVLISLSEVSNSRTVQEARVTPGEPFKFTLDRPSLWSPDAPNRYRLVAQIQGDESELLSEEVGFRRITVDDHDFYLNGKRLLLKGVCRHEFTNKSGYSPSHDEIYGELEAIKRAGFNYVRLVHSPHSRDVCRIAAHLGLFVSEEPGTCFHNLADPAIADPAIESLRRTILRDRNVPSIFAWLIYNECDPNNEFAVRAASVCRELDPGCLVSMADCSRRDDEIRSMVQAADLSFYGINIYTYWPADYSTRYAVLDDRPFVITEWGGVFSQGNLRLLGNHCDNHVHHASEGESLRMAGCSFWAWADYEEFTRPRPAAVDGWTVEGLVSADGMPRPDLDVLSRMCREMDETAAPERPKVEILLVRDRKDETWQTVPLDSIEGDQSMVESMVDEMRLGYRRYDPRNSAIDARAPLVPRIDALVADGIRFECRDIGGSSSPLLLGAGREEALIPVDAEVSSVAVLGHTALKGGYPSSSVYSVHHRDAERPIRLAEPAAEYELLFEDGSVTVSLRHGLEILRSNDICRWWTTAPRTPYTRPALRCVVDPSYEVLRIDLWEKELERNARLKAIRWRLVDRDAVLAMYALSVKTSTQ